MTQVKPWNNFSVYRTRHRPWLSLSPVWSFSRSYLNIDKGRRICRKWTRLKVTLLKLFWPLCLNSLWMTSSLFFTDCLICLWGVSLGIFISTEICHWKIAFLGGGHSEIDSLTTMFHITNSVAKKLKSLFSFICETLVQV